MKDEGAATKRPARFLEDDEGLEVSSHKFLAPSANVGVVWCPSSVVKMLTMNGKMVRLYTA